MSRKDARMVKDQEEQRAREAARKHRLALREAIAREEVRVRVRVRVRVLGFGLGSGLGLGALREAIAREEAHTQPITPPLN